MRPLLTAFGDTLVITRRNLIRIPRAPDLLIGFTVQPVMFVLLFVYVFGGAIKTPGFKYVDYLMLMADSSSGTIHAPSNSW